MASTLHRLSRSNGPVTADARDRSDRLVAFVASVAAASPDGQLPPQLCRPVAGQVACLDGGGVGARLEVAEEGQIVEAFDPQPPELALCTSVPAESNTTASTCILGLSMPVTLKSMTAR